MAAFNKKDLLLYGGYAAFFLACFALFAYWTFPYDRVRDVLEAKVAQSAGSDAAQAKLSIGELGPHWLSGVALSSVVFERGGGPDEKPSRIEVDELTLRASPISLLLGGLDVTFGAEIGDGEIEGRYETEDGEISRVVAELDALDLGRLGIGGYLGVPLAGLGTGAVDVALSEKPAGTQGDVALSIAKLRLGDGETKVKIPGMAGGLTVDTIEAGTLELTIAVRDGIATIEKMESNGKDVELSGSGSIRIARKFMQSRADITLGVKFSDDYKEGSDRTKVAFELISQNPMIKRATGADGMMRFKLTGPLGSLRATPVPAARAPKSARGSKKD